MHINELEQYNLADAVRFHDQLNPGLWGQDEHLLPEVRQALLRIANDFREFLGVGDLGVKDVTISGSNAAYNYTPNSDIDLHLVVDIPELQDEVYRELFNAKKYQYNDQHNIRVRDADVELYVQPSDDPHVSQGIYSVRDGRWISVPRRRRATVDDVSVRNKTQDLEARIQQAIDSGHKETLQNLWDKIKEMRKVGLAQHGEFGAENLVFKLLRNAGWLEKLQTARQKIKDHELSLAERTKIKKPVRYAYGQYQEDVGSTWDGVSATTRQFTSETEQPDIGTIVKQFALFCKKQLGMARLPRIRMVKDPNWSSDNGTFGHYDNNSKTLTISVAKRHIMDVLRTMAHELVHAHQDHKQALPQNAGVTGSRWENEANAVAGRIMRRWAKQHGEMFDTGVVGEDRHANDTPYGPETKPTMPKGTVRVDVSDVYDWYKLGNNIANLKNIKGARFGKGPPSTIVSFGDEDTEHKYIHDLENLGLTTTDIDPRDPNQPRGMPRQKTDPTYNVDEDNDPPASNTNTVNSQAPAAKEPTTTADVLRGVQTIGRTYNSLKDLKKGDAEEELINHLRDQLRNKMMREASGYIPTSAEADDPRYSMALTADIRPGQLGKEANKLNLQTDSQGHPQLLMRRLNNLLESVKQLDEDELLEVKMSPSALAKMARDTNATVGIEFEMYVPNVQEDEGEPPDPEMDLEADESFPTNRDWRREVRDFFTGGDNPESGTRVDSATARVDEEFQEYFQEEFNEYLESSEGFDRMMEIAADNVVQDNYDTEEELSAAVQEYFNENIDSIQEEVREEFDEQRDDKWEEFIADNYPNMFDFMQAFDLNWPYWTYFENDRYGSGSTIEEVADDFGSDIGRPVTAGSYHSGRRSQTNNYRVEYDSSLDRPEDDDDAGLEFISPRLTIDQALKDIDKVVKWANRVGAYTKTGAADGSGGTGLHINVSVPGISADTLDYVKLALFLGDNYVLEQFGRVGNRYAKSALDQIKAQARTEPERLETMMQQMQGKLNNIASQIVHTGRTQKYVTINVHTDKDNFYIEFRAPGGDWLDSYNSDPGVIKNTLQRMAAATHIATHPELYREEYMKKLYKVLKPTEWAKSEPGAPDREIDHKWHEDAIKIFSRYSAGMLPRSVMKSFIRDVQKKREKQKATAEPDVTTQLPSGDLEFTGTWEIVSRNTNEVLAFISGIGNAVVDAERHAERWQQQTGFDDPIYVRPLMRPRDSLSRNQGQVTPGGEQSSDANYEIYSNVSGQPVFRFIANTDEEARRKFQDWLAANNLSDDTEDYGFRLIPGRGIPGSTAELTRQRAELQRQEYLVNYTLTGETNVRGADIFAVNADDAIAQVRSYLDQNGYSVDRIEANPAGQQAQQQFTVDYTVRRNGDVMNNRVTVPAANANAAMSSIRDELEASGYIIDRIVADPVEQTPASSDTINEFVTDPFGVDFEDLYEARMSPSVFKKAVEVGGDLGVLVGFEFEVCVPMDRVKAWENNLNAEPQQQPTVNWGNSTVKGFLQALQRQGASLTMERFDEYFSAAENIPNSDPATKKIMQAYKQQAAAALKSIIDTSIEKTTNYLIDWNGGNRGAYDITQQLPSLSQWNQSVYDAFQENSVIGDLRDPEQLQRFVQRQSWSDVLSRQLDDIERKCRSDYNRIPSADADNPEAKALLAKRVFWSKLETTINENVRGLFNFTDAASRDRFAGWVRRTFGTTSMAALTADRWITDPNRIRDINNILGGHSPDWDPTRYSGSRSNYRRGAEFIKSLIEPAFGKTNIFNSYHERSKNLTDYYIEPDGSLYPKSGDTAAEIVTPPLPAPRAMQVLKQFYSIAKANGFYTGLQHKTGLHINVSIPKTLDLLKLALFVGDEHLLNKFKRLDNVYSRSVIQNLRDTGQGRDWENTSNPMKKLKEIVSNFSTQHSASVSSEAGNYISFRHAGGDYLDQPDDISNLVGRFVRGMIIASDPTAYKQEYINKAMRFAQPKPRNTQDPRKWLKQIREGIPALTIQMYQMTDDAIDDQALAQVAQRKIGTDNVTVVDVVRGEQRIKDNLLASSGWSTATKDQIRAADPSRFIEFTLIPNTPAALNNFNRSLNLNDAYGMYLNGSRVGAGVTAKKDTIDKNSPLYNKVLKRAVRKATDQLMRDRELTAQQQAQQRTAAQQRSTELQPDAPSGPERRETYLDDGAGGTTTLMITADFAEDAARIVADMLNTATPAIQQQWRQRLPLRLRFGNSTVPVPWPAPTSGSQESPPEQSTYEVRDARNGMTLVTAYNRPWATTRNYALEYSRQHNVPEEYIRITDLDNHGVYFIDGTPVTAETMAQRGQQSSAGNSGPWVIVDTNVPAAHTDAVVAVITEPMSPGVAAETLLDRSMRMYSNPDAASRLRIINAGSGQVLTRINQEDDYIDQAYIDRARRAGRGQQSVIVSTPIQGAANGEWIVYRREDGQDRLVYRTNGTRSYDYARDRVLRDADTRNIPQNEFVFYNESSGLSYDAYGNPIEQQYRGPFRPPHTSTYAVIDDEDGEILVPGEVRTWMAALDRANLQITQNGIPFNNIRIVDMANNREYTIRGEPAESSATPAQSAQSSESREFTLYGFTSGDEIVDVVASNFDEEVVPVAQQWADRLGEPVEVRDSTDFVVYTADPSGQEDYAPPPAPPRSQTRTYEILDREDPDQPLQIVTGTLEDAAEVARDIEDQGFQTVILDQETEVHYDPRSLRQLGESRQYGDPAPIYYFAYGMLTDPKLMRGVDLVGAAELPNFTLEFNGYANVVPTPGGRVLGVLWALDRETLSQLDITEGYPTMYDRKTVPVKCQGKRYEAMVYTMTPETVQRLGGRDPTRSYIKSIVNGYNNVGIPLTQISRALD